MEKGIERGCSNGRRFLPDVRDDYFLRSAAIWENWSRAMTSGPGSGQRGAKAESDELGGDVAAEEFGLFQDGLGGFLLLIGRVAVLAEDALDHGAKLGLDAFLDGPIDGSVLVDGVH
jgi:hypothetical protein